MKKRFDQWFVQKSDAPFIQFIRYGFVGGVAFLADFSTLMLLTHYSAINTIVANSIAFSLGLTINYLLSTYWVFSVHAKQSKITEFLLFAIIGLIGLGLNDLVLYALITPLALNLPIAKIGATMVVFFWNFFARKLLLFSSSAQTTHKTDTSPDETPQNPHNLSL